MSAPGMKSLVRRARKRIGFHRTFVGFLAVAMLAGILNFVESPNVEASVPVPAQQAGSGVLTYSEDNDTNAKVRTYDGSANTLSAASTIGSVGTVEGLFHVSKTSPNKRELVSGNISGSPEYKLWIRCFNGSTWTDEFNVGVATASVRSYDIAYENTTGNVMVVYSKNAVGGTAEIGYRTKPAGSGCGAANWSAETTVNAQRTTGKVLWIRVAADPRPGSNLMTMIWDDSNQDLSAMQWSGSAWGNEPSTVLETDMAGVNGGTPFEPVISTNSVDLDVTYETLSGDAMVVWGSGIGVDGTNGTRYTTCTGGTSPCSWLASPAPIDGLLDDAQSLDISSDPTSDGIVFASDGAAGSDMQAAYWSGTAWTGSPNLDTTASPPRTYYTTIATGFLRSGSTTRSLIYYRDSDNGLSFVTGNGATFTVQTDATVSPAFSSVQNTTFDVDPFNADRGILMVTDANAPLYAKRAVMNNAGNVSWTAADGASTLAATTVSSSISQAFAFAYWRYSAASTEVSIDSTAYNARANDGTSPTTVFTTDQIGYAFYRDSNGRCSYAKTIDGGSTWGAAVIVSNNSCQHVAIWYDKWTPGDNGTYIHLILSDLAAAGFRYNRLDTASDTLLSGTAPTQVNAAPGPVKTNTLANSDNYPTISKATNGTIYFGVTDSGTAGDQSYVLRCSTACNTASNWSDTSAVLIDSANDAVEMLPLPNGEMMLILDDSGTDDVLSKVYHSGSSTWDSSWTTIDASSSWSSVYAGSAINAVVDTATNDIYLVYIGDASTLGTNDDIRTAKYSSGTWTAKTNVLTNDARGLVNAQVAFDKNTGSLYVAYAARVEPAVATSANVYWKKSTDGMTTWSAEQGKVNSASMTTGDIAGLRLNVMSDERVYATYFLEDSKMYGNTIADLTTPTYAQSAFRVFNNVNSADVGSALAAQDTAATLPSTGAAFRVRSLIHVDGDGARSGLNNWKLQYVGKGAGTCAAPSGGTPSTYTDVTGGTAIAYNDNAAVADGIAATANANDPSHGGDTVATRSYEEANNFTNATFVNGGQDALVDFSLKDNGAPVTTAYCLRVVKADGTSLDSYGVYPQVTTAVLNIAPSAPTNLAQTKTDNTPIPANTLYNFDASSQGWATDGTSVAQDVITTRTGAGSLKVGFTNPGGAYIADDYFSTRDMSANGPTISAWVYLPSSTTGSAWQAALQLQNTSFVPTSGPYVPLETDKWTLLTFTPSPALLSAATVLSISLSGSGGTGTNYVYVDDVQQGNGITTPETSVRFAANVSDTNTSDNVQLCVEAKPVGTAFTGVEDSCASSVAYSGTPVATSHTLAGFTNNTQYHWQVRAKDAAGLYSSWVAYGGNRDAVTASPDFEVKLPNVAPNAPTGLAQTKTDTTPIPATTHYNFDAGIQAWSNANGAIAAESTIKRTGAGSLKLSTANNGNQIYSYDPVYLTRDLSAYGPTFSTWIYLPAGNTGTGWRGRVELGGIGSGSWTTLQSGYWQLVTYTPPAGSTSSMTGISVSIEASGYNATGVNSVYLDDVQQGNGIATNQTSVRFAGSISDVDLSDNDQLCIEAKPIGTNFSNVEDSCGSAVAYSGTPVPAVHTLTGLVNNTQYHWQARTMDSAGLYSSWVAYGGNVDTATASPDFEIKTNTAPNAPAGLAQTETDSTPIPATTLYTFDSSAQGWTASGGSPDFVASQDATVKRTGNSALKYTFSNGVSGGFAFDNQWGNARDISALGTTISAWVYLPATNNGVAWHSKVTVFNGPNQSFDGAITNLTAGKWTYVSYVVPAAVLSNFTTIGIYAAAGSGASGSNAIYVDDVQQGYGLSTPETSVRFAGSVSDVDSSDTDQLCIEAKPIGTNFTNVEDSCATGVAYSGSPVATAHTLSGFTAGSSYHWQARVKDAGGLYSSWVAYGGNVDTAPASTDFTVNSAPDSASNLSQTRTNGDGIPKTTLFNWDSTDQGWTDESSSPDTTLLYDSTTKRTGAGSLRMRIDNARSYGWAFDSQWGATRDLSANGPTFSTWVYMPVSNTGNAWRAHIGVFDSTYGERAGTPVTLTAGAWNLLTFSPPQDVLKNMYALGVEIDSANGSQTGTNNFYVDDFQQGYAMWTTDTSVKFNATASDVDSGDKLQLCVEKKALGVAFANVEDSCGTAVQYSGTPVALTNTIGSLVDGTQYHWQTRIKDSGGSYSPWSSYGGNAESSVDFGIDSSAPTGGTVYDGTSIGVDAGYNTGTLDTLSANWTGFTANASGLLRYEYAVGTSAGGVQTRGWTSVEQVTAFTATGLNLRTNTTYYFSVRAVDQAGNVQAAVSSNGQMVAPTLTFSVSPNRQHMTNIPGINFFTDVSAVSLTTSTNAYNGYVVRSSLTHPAQSAGARTIPAFNGGTYASPDAWQAGDLGLGYTSNDTTIGGINKFQATTCPGGSSKTAPGCYAPFATSEPGDVVADHTETTTGTPINNESFLVTYRVTTNALQPSGTYRTNILFGCTVTY